MTPKLSRWLRRNGIQLSIQFDHRLSRWTCTLRGYGRMAHAWNAGTANIAIERCRRSWEKSS